MVEQPRAGLGHHDGIDDDGCPVRELVQRLRDGPRRLDAAQHPDLHRVDAEVLGDGPDLREDHVGRDRMDGGHADRVLRGDRGDRCRPVNAGRRERLEVGLDARAAAGVRPGDGEADAHAVAHQRGGYEDHDSTRP